MLQEVLEVTVTLCAVPAAGMLIVVGLMVRYASPAACVMSHTAAVPLLGVTVNCEVREEIVVFSAMFVKVMENENSASAPGSPVIATPLLVETELAR